MIETCSSRCAPAPVMENEGKRPPFISVVVPIRNEAAFIERTLSQLLEQNYDPDRFEILVADGQSTDETPRLVRQIARDHPQVRLLVNSQRLSSAGRNLAIQVGRGDLFVVVDGHCDLDNPDYLKNLADAFERSGADCLGRPQPLDISEANPLQRAIASARASRLGHNPSSHIYSSLECFVRPQSVAVAYRRKVFEKIGLFDESFDACEDVEFNQRLEEAGMTCYFTTRIRVRYHPRNSLGGLFRQMVRYGRGRVRLLRKHPRSLSLPCMLPALFLMGIILGPLVGLASPFMANVYLGSLASYGAVLLLASLAMPLRNHDLATLAWLPLVFVTIHLGAGAGILLEFAAGNRRAVAPEPAYAVQALRVVAFEQQSDLGNREEETVVPTLAFPATHNLAKGA